MSYCSDLTRERIMECAKVEFLKKGFQATQLKDIVTAAKVTTGAIYRHFKDKEALFFALIEDVYHYTLDFLDNAEPYDKVGIREAIERDSVEASYVQAMTYVNYGHLCEGKVQQAGATGRSFKRSLCRMGWR